MPQPPSPALQQGIRCNSQIARPPVLRVPSDAADITPATVSPRLQPVNEPETVMTKNMFYAALLVAAGAANAQSTSSSRPVDAMTGGDKVTPSATDRFGKLDTNHDGKLSFKEFGKMDAKLSVSQNRKLFNAWNTDKDDFISPEEFMAASAQAASGAKAPKTADSTREGRTKQ